MAPRSDYVTGTITLTNGLSTFTGAGTAWELAGFREGDEIKQIEGQTQWEAMVATITSNTGGTLVRPWGGATGTFAYRMRFQPDGSRVTAQARELIELLGDGTLLSLAGLVGPGVIELLPGGGAQVVPKTDLVSGANYDVQVATLAARAAYDGQAAGFSVLVADVGDGRAAIYSKITNASGNWSAPAYVTGPTGAVSTVPGVVWRGTYAAGTTYAINDGVTFNGSSFRKLTNAAAGTAPSSASPPVNTAAWEVLAAKGTNGSGTGDLVGPNGGVAADQFMAFADSTGKVAKVAPFVPLNKAGDTATGRIILAQNPAFLALLTANQPVGNGDAVIALTNVIGNRGGHWASPRFTAPVAAYYSFNGVVQFADGASGIGAYGVGLRVNGVSRHVWYTSKTNYYLGSPFSFTVFLNANDYVELYSSLDGASGNPFCQLSRTWMAGYLIG